MRYALLLLLLACADSSGPDSGVQRCMRPDEGTGCSQSDVAVKSGTTWQATVYITQTANISYEDGGFLCILQRRSCTEKHCTFTNAPANWTASTAISQCRQ